MTRKKSDKNSQIIKRKLLLVEGKDELNLFSELLIDLKLEQDIQIIDVGGKDKFQNSLAGLRRRTGFNTVASVGIVRDADDNPGGAFQSVCSALKNTGLPQPHRPLQRTDDTPQVTIMVVPGIETKGMIEDVCLESVRDDPAMICVEQYFQCLAKQRDILPQNIAKARVHTFLASREWLEIAYFEALQNCLAEYVAQNPSASSLVIPKVHAFLASRYTPNLRLGDAAKKQQDDRYWQFNHVAFDKIKQFLHML